jgi:hypothetical protein
MNTFRISHETITVNLSRLVRRLVEKYDWFIYHRAFHSIRRMCASNAGFAYLFELYIKKYRAEHPITPELERATERFFDALNKSA